MYKLSEILKANVGVLPASAQTATSAVYLPIADYDRFMGIGEVATLTTTKILTVQLVQAKTAGGGSTKSLGDAGTFTADTTLGLTGIAVAEASGQDVDSAAGFKFVGVTVSHDEGSGVVQGGILIRGMGKNRPVS